MARKLDYHWHLRQVLADRGMFATTDLIEPLARRGIALSSSQVYRLVVERPERLSLKILMALLDILDCSMSELIEPAAPGGGRFDQLAHRAVQDVQQRHQDLQAQAFGSFDDEAVNLAGGQRDPAPGQRFDQVGGGEHAAVGQHLPQVPVVVEFAGHQVSSPYRCVLGASSAGPSALRSAVFMKSPLTWVSVSYTHLRAHETVLDLVCRL